MIQVDHISKSFGDNLVLDDLYFQLDDNKIYGLLGRNGAGKTTLLKILSNQIINYQGAAYLNDQIIKENQAVTEKILLVHHNMVPETLTTDKVSKIYRWAKMILPNWDEDYKNQLVKTFNLNTKKAFYKLSEGQQNLVTLILGLAAGSDVVFFDEPANGLDANNRQKFYQILLDLCQREEKLVIISSHVIDELENILEEVLILEGQNIILKEDISILQGKALILSGNKNSLAYIEENKNVISRRSIGETLILSIYDELTDEEKFKLAKNNVDIQSESLQNLFIALTNKEEL